MTLSVRVDRFLLLSAVLTFAAVRVSHFTRQGFYTEFNVSKKVHMVLNVHRNKEFNVSLERVVYVAKLLAEFLLLFCLFVFVLFCFVLLFVCLFVCLLLLSPFSQVYRPDITVPVDWV